MTSHVALLRAVNVGGRSLAMSALRDFASALGLGEPRTLLQSGNLIFRSTKTKSAELERLLELIEQRIGTRGTGRNWNTVVKLAAAAGA